MGIADHILPLVDLFSFLLVLALDTQDLRKLVKKIFEGAQKKSFLHKIAWRIQFLEFQGATIGS